MHIFKHAIACTFAAALVAGGMNPAVSAPMPTHVGTMKAMVSQDTTQVYWRGGGWRGGGWGWGGFGVGALAGALIGGAIASTAYGGYYGGMAVRTMAVRTMAILPHTTTPTGTVPHVLPITDTGHRTDTATATVQLTDMRVPIGFIRAITKGASTAATGEPAYDEGRQSFLAAPSTQGPRCLALKRNKRSILRFAYSSAWETPSSQWIYVGWRRSSRPENRRPVGSH